MYFLAWIVIGSITGWFTGQLLEGGGYGPMMDTIMGLAGGVAGGFMMRLMSSPAHGGLVYTSVAALLGAGILTGLLGLVHGGRRYA